MLYIAPQTKLSRNILHNTQQHGAPDVTNPGGLKEGRPSPIQNTKLTKTRCWRRHSPLVPSNQGRARRGRWAPDRLLTRCALQSVRPSPPGTLAAPSPVRWQAASDEWLLRDQRGPRLRSPHLPHPQIFPFQRLRRTRGKTNWASGANCILIQFAISDRFSRRVKCLRKYHSFTEYIRITKSLLTLLVSCTKLSKGKETSLIPHIRTCSL